MATPYEPSAPAIVLGCTDHDELAALRRAWVNAIGPEDTWPEAVREAIHQTYTRIARQVQAAERNRQGRAGR